MSTICKCLYPFKYVFTKALDSDKHFLHTTSSILRVSIYGSLHTKKNMGKKRNVARFFVSPLDANDFGALDSALCKLSSNLC